MKFKTRLRVTFATIIVLPLLLTALAFMTIGVFLMKRQQEVGFKEMDTSTISDSVQTIGKQTQELYESLLEQLEEDPTVFEDKGYLQSISDGIGRKNSYILVRKGKDIYYTGNESAAEQIIDKLPGYGYDTEVSSTGFYFNDSQKYVKQLDFTFSDGTPGSLFIITKVTSLISRTLLVDMFIAIFVILIFTSFMLTRWIHHGVFDPINQLNVAMKKSRTAISSTCFPRRARVRSGICTAIMRT